MLPAVLMQPTQRTSLKITEKVVANPYALNLRELQCVTSSMGFLKEP
jgi:hypothetical protein